MPSDLPSVEPSRITAGDSASWRRSFGAYPASDGWVLTYTFINAQGKKTVVATADGDDFLVNLAAATTASWAAGIYSWSAAVAKAPDRYTVAMGQIEVQADFASATALDTRTAARKALDAADAALATYGNKAYLQSYSIVGRTMAFRNPSEFLAWRSSLKAEVRRESAAADLAAGRRPRNMVYVRFNTR